MRDWLDKIFNMDALEGIKMIPDNCIDLVIADQPYGLGKDYGNDSDKKEYAEFLRWTEQWLSLVIPKIKQIEIIERMIKASCPENGVVFDPFAGSGTTIAACLLNHRQYLAFEINPDYYQIIMNRIERVKI